MQAKFWHSVLVLTALLCALSGCAGGRAVNPGPAYVPASLAEALQLIKAEEARASQAPAHNASVIPETQFGDDVWVAGPASTVTIDTVSHRLTLASSTSSLSSPGYLSFGIFKYPGNTGKQARHFFLDIVPDTEAVYTVYVVRYFSEGLWDELGTFTGNPGGNGLPTDLPNNCISPAGNVYVAVVVADQKTLTVNSTRVSDLFETENNDNSGSANRLPFANGSATAVVDGQIGSGAPGGDTDGDSSDWFYFSAPGAGLLYLGLDYTNSTGRVDSYLYAGDTTTLLDSGGLADGDEYIVERIYGPGNVFLKLDCTAGYASYTVDVQFDLGVYADVENNDSSAAPNVLGPFPFAANTTGEIGPAGTNDGDLDDWYSFSGATGLARIKLFLDHKSSVLAMDLVAPDGSTLVDSADLEQGYYVIERLLPGSTLFIHVMSMGDTDSYFLQCASETLGLQQDATEVEHNDFSLSANSLPPFPFTTDEWIGSVGFGSGMRNYDGDRSDWSSFSIGGSGTVDFTLYLNTDDGDLDLYLYDAVQTLISSDTSFGNTASLSVLLPGAGTYYLEVRGAHGGSDYTLEGDFTP